MRTRSRSPANSFVEVRVVPGPQTAKQTVPTGLSGAPPSGPATPVIATATDEPQTRLAPSAISRAVGSLTAPKSALAPDSEVASSPARPPVQDSANASVASWARSDLETAPTKVSPSMP